MIKKKVFVLLSGILLVSALSGIVAASSWGGYDYGYNAPGRFDSVSYHTSRSSGWYGGPVQTKSTNYDKVTSERILRDGTREKRTTYVRVDRESPRYGYYGNYGAWDGTGWYRKYYTYPNYPRQYYMGSYEPMMYGYW